MDLPDSLEGLFGDEESQPEGYEERIRRAQLARSEARETISEQTDTLSDIDDKAIQVFRLNLLLAGVIATGFSVASTNNDASIGLLVNQYTAIGYIFLLISIVFASLTYTTTATRIGLQRQTLEEEILDLDYDYDIVEEEIAIKYAEMVERNFEKNVSNVLLFTLTLIATVAAVVYFATGLLNIRVEESLPLFTHLVIFLFLLIFGKLSGVYGTIYRWWTVTDPHKRLWEWVTGIC